MSTKPTLADRLEALFRSRPGVWLDGRELAKSAGFYGWRSRLVDVRRRGLDIENRQRTIRTSAGKVAISEYRWTPPMPTKPARLPFDQHGEAA